MSDTTVNTAPCKWAQRSDTIYLTIALPDVKEEKINLEESKLTFAGVSNKKKYEIAFDFFKPIDKEGSIIKVLDRSVQMLLKKKEPEEGEEEEFWPRLLKDKHLEKGCVTIDWDRYVDEDEEDEAGAFDQSNLAGGMDMASMMGGGGMPGMGGMGGMPGMGGMGGMGGMPGMGGMGGMPGMGGMGGMGGMPGMGGPGGMDMEALMKQMGDLKGGMPGMGEMPDLGDDEGDSDDDDLPDLEVEDKDAN